jgi:SAM-dependent methyltransferase
VRRLLLRTLERAGLLVGAFRAYETLRSLRPFQAPAADDGFPLPPARLRLRVAGTADPVWFLESGKETAATIADAFGRHGLRVERAGRLLDFGCGCGRVIRHWQRTDALALEGCDRDADAVAWCREQLRFARFESHAPAPPLSYADASFGAAYAVSVFTHLPEEDQRPWAQELRRLLVPGGLLVLTTHGERYAERLDPDERASFASGRLVVRWPSAAGTNLCTTFHPERYVREVVADGFELLELAPGAAEGTPHQDLIVLRKP